jgi:hypothetical protein
VALGYTFNRLVGVGDGLCKSNAMVRGGGRVRVIRLDRLPDDGDHVVLANVGHQHIQDRLSVCRLGHQLSEGRVDIKEELGIEVIFISPTYKG